MRWITSCGISVEMAKSVAVVRASGLMALACAASACADPTARIAAERECRLRLVVGFVAASAAIDVAALGAVAGAQIRLIESLLPDLAVLELTAAGDDTDCAAALERLRTAPAVRSAEAEQRRKPHSG